MSVEKIHKKPIRYKISDINKAIIKSREILQDVLDEKDTIPLVPDDLTNLEVKKYIAPIINNILKLPDKDLKWNKYCIVYAAFLLSRYSLWYLDEKFRIVVIKKADELYKLNSVDYRGLISFDSEKIPTLEDCLGILPI